MNRVVTPIAGSLVQTDTAPSTQTPAWPDTAQASVLEAARLALARDLRLAFRKRDQLVQPLAFYAMVTMLFPLSISPELSRLREVAPGVLWAGALLASLLALEFLFRDDAYDGTLEQYALSGQSLTWLMFAKTVAHWLLTGLPLALMAPLAGLSLGVPAAALPGIVVSVAVGSIALSLIGSIGAALTLGVKRSSALLALLTLPLSLPVLIFGARATQLAISGGPLLAPLELLAALAVLGVTLAPLGLLIVAGLWGGLVLAPPDYQQGDGFRIIYVHAPSAWMSLMVYTTMAIAAAVGLIWRIKVAHAVAASCAPIGASFTFAALVTGALWGQPMWGTYWAWDPRLTSELILLFLYLGYMGLRAALEDTQRADRASGVLAVVGVVNVPIIHYSVTWWNSLHQAPTVMALAKPKMAASMLVPLLMMLLGFTLFFGAILLVRLRGEVLSRERSASWIREVVGA
ncbi:MAG: heme exporter protein CcmB [Gammaproteobacteria bacterium]|nr:MAG: heme exporter protein CcmB [Gammaproteobacteria bacterium]